MSLPRYPEYSDSGVEWLDKYPKHWIPKPLKAIAVSLQNGAAITGESIEDSGDFPVYGGNGLRGFTGAFTHAGPRVLIGRVGALCGNIHLATGRYWASEHAIVVTPNRGISLGWLAYTLESMNLGQYSRAAAQPVIAIDVIGNLRVPIPSPGEQDQIADFLDRETAKIDALIAKQEQLIASLREDRTATITHAVTKGLDPDVEMQDSRVEWIGETPAHWCTTQMRYLAERIEQGVSPQADAELAETGWGVLKAGCVNGGVFVETQHKKLPDDFTIDPSIVVGTGDLLVSRASGSPDLVGSTAVVGDLRYQLILSDKIFRIVPSILTSSRYLEWAMNSRMYREQVKGAISGAEGLANNLPMTALKTFRFALPPIAEQERIAAYLLTECLKIDTLIGKADEMVSTLREYRAALITDVVTGKIDVRGAA